MSRTYCGACRGERGCAGCKATDKTVVYTGLTQFCAEENRQTDSTASNKLLLAADLGTTTLAFVCADENGRVLASFGTENPQRKSAADVIGRIDAAMRGERENLKNEIREALVKGFLFVLEKAYIKLQVTAGIPAETAIRIAVAGNTVMQHLLLDYEVDGLAKAPFIPYSVDLVRVSFAELFSETKAYTKCAENVRSASVTVFPCLSAFVGGDVVAGAYALFPGVWEKQEANDFCESGRGDAGEQIRLLMDLGTNGELLLFAGGKVYGTAAAMGCAFEGGRFAYASDLFRLIATALREGVMDETGLLCDPYFSEDFQGLSQEDVREFQLAKGALRAGIDILCTHAMVTLTEIGQVYVAGGIGSFCQPEELFEAGLLPKEFQGKTELAGNSCIGGLLRYLKNGESMLYCRGEILNLAELPEFAERYYEAMNFVSEDRK